MISESLEKLARIEASDNPFPGLRPFELHESHLFFGREGQSERLLAKLQSRRFLAVVGTSGSGKSSLARAGLIPALLGGMMRGVGSDWRVAVLRPGNDPIGALARALNAPDVFGSDNSDNAAIQASVTEETLRRGNRGLTEAVRLALRPEDENLLVVVDQFEELFRFARQGSAPYSSGTSYENDAAAFVKLLLEAVKPSGEGLANPSIFVVLTMRSDFLGDCAQFWDLPEAVSESQYLIPRLTRDQLREVIEGPVAVGGGQIAPRLVNQLLNDIADNQDQLPILQHALMRTWEEWRAPQHKHLSSRDEIDVCCYEAIGGMEEALSRHADEAYGELDGRQQKSAERMFKALSERGEDNREIRRPATLAALAAVVGATEGEVKAVIEKFRQPGRSFLMPPAETRLHANTLIDLSHESLIRVWGKLVKWVKEEAESAAIYRRLAETAALHAIGEADFLGKLALKPVVKWRKENAPNPQWAARYESDLRHKSDLPSALAFLEASRKNRGNEIAERRRSRREKTEFEQLLKQAAEKSIGIVTHNLATQSAVLPLFLSRYRLREKDLPELKKLNNDFERALESVLTVLRRAKELLIVVMPKFAKLELLDYLGQVCHAALPEHNYVITSEIGQIQVEADSHLLEMALLELIENSKNVHSQSPQLCIEFLIQQAINDPASLQIAYRDNGPGIPAEIQERMFEPFFSQRPTGQRSSTGLGLSFVRRVIEAHGGDIRVGAPVKGAEFIITLPKQITAQQKRY